MAYKEISQDTRDEWSRLHAEGLTSSEIARQYGVRQETVSRSLKGLTKAVGRPRKREGVSPAQGRRAYYTENRERIIARQKAYYRENREARLAYGRAVSAKVAEIERSIIRTFELLPVESRGEYAHWLLVISAGDYMVSRAISAFRADDLMGTYAGI